MPRSTRRREPSFEPDPNIDINEPRQLRPKTRKNIAQQYKRKSKVSQKAIQCIEPPECTSQPSARRAQKVEKVKIGPPRGKKKEAKSTQLPPPAVSTEEENGPPPYSTRDEPTHWPRFSTRDQASTPKVVQSEGHPMVVDRSAAQDKHGRGNGGDEYEVDVSRKTGGHDHEDEDEDEDEDQDQDQDQDEEIEVQGAFDRDASELEYVPSERDDTSDNASIATVPDRPKKGKKTSGDRSLESAPTMGVTSSIRTDANVDDDNTVDDLKGWKLKPGPISDEGMELIDEFQALVVERADEIGRYLGKSRRDILVAAGFGVKNGRKVNSANIFRKWYYATKPKPDDMTMNQYNRVVDEAYKDLFKGIPLDDDDAREKIWKPIREFASTPDISINRTIKSILSRVQECKNQLSGIAEAWSVTGDMQVMGIVCYTGSDSDGRSLSGLFTGSKQAAKWIAEDSAEVRQIVDYFTMLFKFKSFRDALQHHGVPQLTSNASRIARRPQENERDRMRRALRMLFIERLGPYLQLVDSEGAEQQERRINWESIFDTLYRHQLVILKYPTQNPPLDADFRPKKLTPRQLESQTLTGICRIMGALYDGPSEADLKDKRDKDPPALGECDGGFVPEWEVHPWQREWRDISDDDPKKGTVPLIIDVVGKVVSVLADCPTWVEARDSFINSKRSTLQKQLAYNSVHGGRSAGTSMNIVAEHPRKRIRNDDREDGAIPERVWNEHGPKMMEPGLQAQNTQVRLNKPATSRTTSEQHTRDFEPHGQWDYRQFRGTVTHEMDPRRHQDYRESHETEARHRTTAPHNSHQPEALEAPRRYNHSQAQHSHPSGDRRRAFARSHRNTGTSGNAESRAEGSSRRAPAVDRSSPAPIHSNDEYSRFWRYERAGSLGDLVYHED